MEKQQEKIANRNKLIGNRLQECRKYRGYTQTQLADMLGYQSDKSIQNWESGRRKINNDTAISIAKILNINVDYLLCKTDTLSPNNNFSSIGDSIIDTNYIQMLSLLGYSFVFHIIKIYDGKKPQQKKWNEFDYPEWESISLDATIEQLKSFSAQNPHCKFDDGKTISEVLIYKITITRNGINKKITFGEFNYIINNLLENTYRILDYDLNNSMTNLRIIDCINDGIHSELNESRYIYGVGTENPQKTYIENIINNNSIELELASKKEKKENKK